MINSKLAIISTVVNFELFSKTSPFFPQVNYHYIIDGRNGMHGLESIFYTFKKLKNTGIEWLIMADEDVIFQNTEKIFRLIEYMKIKNYQVAGIREGGVIPHKPFNPYAINTFFSIIHFSEIEKVFNKEEIKKNQYIDPNEFAEDLSKLQLDYNTESLYEPYYCFYFWLKRKGYKFLYLNAGTPFPDDEFTTSVFDPEGDLLLYHTWYARAYGSNKKHTQRINKLLELIPKKEIQSTAPVVYKDSIYGWKLQLKKFFTKIKIKIEKLVC